MPPLSPDPTSYNDYSDAITVDDCLILAQTDDENLDTENHSKALFDINLEEDTTPPNPSPPRCVLQQMMQKPSNWWNNSHYMLTVSSIGAFRGRFILKQPYLYCDCIVTDGHMPSKVRITVATRFKSGDRIQAEHYNLGALSKCLLISQYTCSMRTSRAKRKRN
jgi:hypothetical protein